MYYLLVVTSHLGELPIGEALQESLFYVERYEDPVWMAGDLARKQTLRVAGGCTTVSLDRGGFDIFESAHSVFLLANKT